MQKHIQDKPPEEYQRCLTGINQVLKLSWQIANANSSGQEDSNGSSKTITTIVSISKSPNFAPNTCLRVSLTMILYPRMITIPVYHDNGR